MANLSKIARANLRATVEQNRSIISAVEASILNDFPEEELSRLRALTVEIETLLK